MSRSRIRHRIALSAILMGFTLLAAGSPAQARENPPSGWLDALVQKFAQELPASWWSWSSHPGDRASATSKKARLQVDVRVKPLASTGCLSPAIDPDGCPH